MMYVLAYGCICDSGLIINLQNFLLEKGYILADNKGHELASIPGSTNEYCLIKNTDKYRKLCGILNIRIRRPLIAIIKIRHPKVWYLYIYGLENATEGLHVAKNLEKHFDVAVGTKVEPNNYRHEHFFF